MLIVELGLKAALVFSFFFIIPYVVGCLPVLRWKWYRPGVASALVFGTVLLWAVFYVIAGPCALFRPPFFVLVTLVSVAWGLCVLVSLVTLGKKIWEPLRSLGQRLRRPALLPTLAVTCIIATVAVPVFLKHQDEDDAFYVVLATDAVQSGTIHGHAPYSGDPVGKSLGAGVSHERVLAPFHLLVAYYAAMTGVHPAITAHTVLPATLIPLAFAVYLLLARFLFPAREDHWVFLLIMCATLVFGGFSPWAGGAFLLLRIWQGKAVLAGIFLPLLFLLLMWAVSEGLDKRLWCALFTVVLAADLTTAMTFLFVPTLVAAFCLIILLRQRRMWSALVLLAAALPALAQGLAYRYPALFLKYFA